MIFITDELGKFEKNIIELAENVGFKECKTIEAIDLFCGISEKNDVLKEKDRYYAFIDIYEFVNNVGDRHNHNCYLVMVTMNTLPEQLADIEEIEKALDCMEQSIRSKIRKVDVCTRYSSMQYLIILFEPQENQIPNVMERIFMHYYELCDRENFKPQYEYIKMTEVK